MIVIPFRKTNKRKYLKNLEVKHKEAVKRSTHRQVLKLSKRSVNILKNLGYIVKNVK